MVMYGSCSKLIKNMQPLKQKASCYRLDQSVVHLIFHNTADIRTAKKIIQGKKTNEKRHKYPLNQLITSNY